MAQDIQPTDYNETARSEIFTTLGTVTGIGAGLGLGIIHPGLLALGLPTTLVGAFGGSEIDRSAFGQKINHGLDRLKSSFTNDVKNYGPTVLKAGAAIAGIAATGLLAKSWDQVSQIISNPEFISHALYVVPFTGTALGLIGHAMSLNKETAARLETQSKPPTP